MSWFRRLLGRDRLERELDREIRFHLDAHVADLVRAGIPADEARRQARIALGGPEQIKEDTRDVRGTRWLEDWWADTHYALRSLRRAPSFTAAAVLTLAIGIGANTAVFSAVHAILLQPLPLERPDQLAVVRRSGFESEVYRFSVAGFDRLRSAAGSGARLAVQTPASPMYATIGASPERISGQLVSGDFFAMLGVGAVAGRLLDRRDDRAFGESPVVVLSERFWTRRFGRDPAAVGASFRINGVPVTVVGVAEPSFFGMTVGRSPDVWAPVTMQHPLRYHGNASTRDADPEKAWGPQEGMEWLQVLVRRSDSVAAAVLTDRLDRVHRLALIDRHAGADSAERRVMMEHLVLEPAERGLSEERNEVATPLMALMVSVGLVLLIACANLASLLLARSAARTHEVAVRISLGARAGRLVRQVLTESLTLAMIGGVAGVALAFWGGKALLGTSGSSQGVLSRIQPSPLVLLFAFGLTLFTGLAFGAAPAFRTARLDLFQSFKGGGRVAGESRDRVPLGRLLVGAQVALSLALVVLAALFVRTLANLMAVDPGYHAGQVITAEVDIRAAGYQQDQLPGLYRRLHDGVAAVPGVNGASMSLYSIAGRSMRTSGFVVPGDTHSPEWDNSAQENFVTERYFETVGLRLVRGRTFTLADTKDAPPVAVINEAAARHFFGTGDPIGRRIGYDSDGLVEVVGVVADARVNTLRDVPPRLIYQSLTQHPEEFVGSLEVRVDADPAAVIPAIRAAITATDPALPIREVVTVADLLDRGLRAERLISELAGVFGALALLLAAVGLYGVMAYTVARRTNELGVRLALGATPAAVRRLVLRDTLGIVVGGLAFGFLLLMPTLGLVRSLLHGVSPRDPATLIAAGGVLLVVGAAAGAIPAWRASRVDPIRALRRD